MNERECVWLQGKKSQGSNSDRKMENVSESYGASQKKARIFSQLSMDLNHTDFTLFLSIKSIALAVRTKDEQSK